LRQKSVKYLHNRSFHLVTYPVTWKLKFEILFVLRQLGDRNDSSGTTDSASESAFFIHNSRYCEFLKRFTCNFDSIQVKTSGNLFGNLPYVN
jgi:hypothetical protein